MKVVTDFSEIEGREEYDPDAAITLDNFQSLVKPYNFKPDWKLCQVKSKNDKKNLCGRKHWEGWLGKTKAGPEGLIGKDCADHYFDAHTAFRAERKRIDDALALTERVEQLESLLLNENLETVISTISQRMHDVQRDLSYIVSKVPKEVANQLRHMARTGRPAVVVEILRTMLDTNRHGEKFQRPMPYAYTLGNVAGYGVLDLEPQRLELLGRLRTGKRALQEATATRSAGYKALGKWIDEISPLERASAEADAIEQELRAYTAPANLRLQIYVTNDRQAQHRMAALAIEFSPDTRMKDPNELIREYAKQIMAANDQWAFRAI